MRAPYRLLLASLLCSPIALLACGTGKGGKAVQPDMPTAASAVDAKPACENPKDPDQPLVVDMPPEQRADLEIAMRNHVAVVSYDCKSLKIMRDCHLDGDYGFFGTTLQEKTVRLTNADEINVNLPLAGVGLIAKLGGSLKSGSTLDLAMMMIGARRTTWNHVKTDDLKGTCDGATHFVFGAFIGAFALQQGVEGSVATTASVFGASADASSSSAKSIGSKSGDPDACNKADPMAHEPPSKCGVAIRLELLPIGIATTGSEEKPHPAANLNSDECPGGYVLTDGKCAKPGTGKVHQCDGKDPIDCAKQCDLGDGTSCGRVGDMYRIGQSGMTKDSTKGFGYEKRGCDLKDPMSCYWQAKMMIGGEGTAKDMTAAVVLLKQACMIGSAVACHDAAISFINHQPASWPDAFPFFDRGCDGGDQRSCGAIALCYSLGGGACGSVAKDVPRAMKLWARACNGGVAESCRRMGERSQSGDGANRDIPEAARLYKKGCDGKDAIGCLRLGQLYEKGGDHDLQADPKQAVAYFERALPQDDAQLYYGNALIDGKTIPGDRAKGVKLLKAACAHEKKYDAKKLPGCDALTKLGEKVD